MAVGPLVVATFSIRNGLALDGWHSWPLRRRSTAAALRNLDADVIGLQEAYRFQLRYLRKAVPGYESRSEGRIDGRRGERCPTVRDGHVVADPTVRPLPSDHWPVVATLLLEDR